MTTKIDSDTPRTDALAKQMSREPYGWTFMEWVELAQSLERELAEANRALADAVRERDELRERQKFPPPKGTLYGDPETIKEVAALRSSVGALVEALEGMLECMKGCEVFIHSREKINAQEGPGWIKSFTDKARAALAQAKENAK